MIRFLQHENDAYSAAVSLWANRNVNEYLKLSKSGKAVCLLFHLLVFVYIKGDSTKYYTNRNQQARQHDW